MCWWIVGAACSPFIVFAGWVYWFAYVPSGWVWYGWPDEEEISIRDRDPGWEGREEYSRRKEFTRRWLEQGRPPEDGRGSVDGDGSADLEG